MNENKRPGTSPKLESVRAQYRLEEKMKSEGMGYELSTMFRSQGRFTEATQEIRNLMNKEGKVGYQILLIETYLENQQIEQALLNIDEVLSEQNGSGLFYFLVLILKVECLVGLSRTGEAMLSIHEALALREEDEVMAWKGIAHMKLNEIEAAKKCFDRSLFHNPSNEKAWLGVGSVHCLKGDYELGLACYKRAKDIDGKNRVAHQLMAKFEYYGREI